MIIALSLVILHSLSSYVWYSREMLYIFVYQYTCMPKMAFGTLYP